MGEILTIEQMTSDFPLEWVLIGEPRTDEGMRLEAGRVLHHSPDRDEVYLKALEMRLPDFAVRHLGTMPEDMTLIL